MVGPYFNKSRYRAGQSIALTLLAFLAFGGVTAHAAKRKPTQNEQFSSLETEGGDAPETRPLLMPSGSTLSNDSEFAGPAYVPPQVGARPMLAGNQGSTEESSDSMGDGVPLPLPPPPTLAEVHAAAVAGQLDAVPYDSVPPAQKDAIRKRIKLVDRMILKYGRAYDYRAHTLRQLEAISAELDEEAKQQALRNR